MSKSNLNQTSLEFTTLAGARKVLITSGTNSLDFEGDAASDVNLTGVNNITIGNNVTFNDKQLTPNTKSITLAAPSVITGSSYSLTLPPVQGASNSYLKNNGGGSLTWDTIPITSFSYRFVRATANQTTIGSLVTFDGTSTGEGTLAFSGGVFTLAAGKTYYLQGTVDQITTSSATFTFNYRWYDTTNSTYIGVAGNVINSSTAGSSTNDIAYGVVSPTASINVQLQIVSSVNVTSINASATGGPAALVYEIITGTGTIGDVIGPASSVDNAIVRFDGTSGKIIQNSNILITDTDDIQGASTLQLKQSTNTVTLTPGSNTLTLTGTTAGSKVALAGIFNASLSGSLILAETTAGINTITISAPSAVTTSYSLTLPAAQGVSNTYLKNDGSGILTWGVLTGTGDVVGPASATDNAIVRFDTTTGKLIQNSLVIISDTADISGLKTIALSGSTSGALTIRASATTVDYTLTLPAGQGDADTYLKNDGTGVLTWASAGSGSVSGPVTSTDNALARFDGTTGKIIQNSTAILSDTGAISGLISIGMNDAGSNTVTINTPTAITASYTLTLPVAQSTSSKTSALYNDGTGALSWQTDPVSFTGTTPVSYLIPVFADSTGRRIKRIIGNIALSDTDEIQNINKLEFNKDNLYIGADPIRIDVIKVGKTTDLNAFVSIDGINNVYFNGSLVFGVQPGFRGSAYPINFPSTSGVTGDVLILGNASTGQLNWSSTLGGDVTGPSSSMDNAIARFDGTTGKLIQNSTITLTDTADITGVKTLGLSGSSSGILNLQPAASVTDYTIKLPSSQGLSGQVMINDGSGNLVWGDRSNVSGIGVYGYYNSLGGWDSSRRMNLDDNPVINTDVIEIAVVSNIIVLNPGTWELTAVWQGTNNAGGSTIQWYNEVTNSFVGNLCIIPATNSASTYNSGNVLVYSITAPSGVNLSIRETGSGTLEPSLGFSYVYMKKLNDTPFNPAATTEYLMGALTANVTTNLSAGDHIKFNSLLNSQSSNGTTNTGNISLDTTTPYTTTANVDSLGRITLKAGRTYELTGYAQSVADLTNGTFTYAWYNSNASLTIGSIATYFPNMLTGTVTIGDVGGNPTGSLTCTGNILTATKTNASLTQSYSLILITYPNMGVVPNATITIRDASGAVSGVDNDIFQPIISAISATSLSFWIEETTGSVQNIIASLTISSQTTGGARINGPSKAIYRPLTDTRVELRILSGAMFTNFSSDTYAEIVTLIGDPNSNPFIGATASSAGSQGLVPTPAAGQQDRFLRGDATWQNAASNSSGSSTDNALTRWDGTSGNYIQNSTVTLSDTGDIVGIRSLNLSGSTSGVATLQAAAVTTGYSMTLPSAQGSTGSVLTNNGSGTLTWSTPANGNVFGPASSTTNAIAKYTDTTGTSLSNTSLTISSTSDLAGVRTLTMPGSSSGTLTLVPFSATSSYTLTFPPGQGSSGQVLTNDGTGVLSWTTSGAGTGDVSGPTSATDNAIARFDTTTGKLIQNSLVTITDTGDIAGTKSLELSGATSGALTIYSAPTTTSYSVTFPSAQGSSGTYLRNNGTGTLSWDLGTSGNLLNVQTFVSAAGTFTYTPTAGTKRALVYVLGGGGAGGGAVSGATKSGGCGGTGGGCQVGLFVIDPTQTGTAVVGTGGTGVSGSAGGAGSTSTFTFSGATITGAGGAGGSLATSSALTFIVQPSIVGGTSTGVGAVLLNTYTIYGSLGARGELYSVANTLIAGAGGNSAFGGGANVGSAASASTGANGTAGTNGVGGGGSGGYQTNGTAFSGGAGGFGGVYVFEYTDIYGGAGGDVDGPTGATNTALSRFYGTSGKILQNSLVTLSDTGDLVGAKTFGLSGATSGTITIQPAATTDSYTIILPSAQGVANTYLKNDGAGVLTWSSGSGGDVTGPSSSTDNSIARFDSTTGKIIQNSLLTIGDTGTLSGVRQLDFSGSTSGTMSLHPAATITTYSLTFPQSQGLSGQVLQNDGTGSLSWVSQSSAGIAVYGYYNASGGWDNTTTRRMNLNSTPILNTSATQISVTTNIITLQAGTWELTAVWQGSAGGGGATFQWYNEGTSAFVGNQCQTPAANSGSTVNSGNILVYSLVLTSSGTFSVRDTGTGNMQPTAINSYIYAKKLSDTPYNPAPTSEYLVGALTADVTTNLVTGDHIKFNTLLNNQSSNGTTNTGNISLDTTTAYTTTANVASLGRITLKAGRTYELTGYAQSVAALSSGVFSYAWFNSDTSVSIGSTATYFPNMLTGTVTIGDIGGGTSGSISCSGNILTATKTNGNIGNSASTIVVTYPDMYFTPSVSITIKDASNTPTTSDNDIAIPVVSVIGRTSLTFWIEESSGSSQNIVALLTISTQTNGGVRANGPSKAIYTPPVDTRVELRITNGSMATNFSSDTYAEVVTLIGAPNTLPFNGATAGSAGSQGLVPVPTAGQQSRFLRGDSTWAIVPSSSSGSSTDNAVVRWDGATGTTIQNSLVILSDTGGFSGVTSLSLTGSASGTILIQPAATVTTYTVTLPSTQGVANSVLANNGSGALTWATTYTRTSGAVTDRSIVTYSGTTGSLVQAAIPTITSLGEIGNVRSLLFSGSTSGVLTLTAPSAVVSYSLTMPSGQGGANTTLVNNGSGILSWQASSGITGPGTSTDTAVVRWSGTTGRIIQDSGVLVSSTNVVSGVRGLTLSGSSSGTITLQPAAVITTSYTLTLPSAQGLAATFLRNDGTGVLTWSSPPGNVTGPVSSTDNALARFSLTTGTIIKNSTVLLSDAGGLTGVATLGLAGSASGTLTQSAAATTSSYAIRWPSVQGAFNTILRNDGSGNLAWGTGGDVTGPSSSADNAIARYDGLTGKIIQNSSVTISDTSDIAGAKTLSLDGSTSGTITLRTAAATVSYTATMPSAQGSAGTYLRNDGTGALTWTTAGNVAGPGTSTVNALSRYSDTTGQVLKNSTLVVTDTGDLSGVRSLVLSGATSGTLTINPAGTTSTYSITMPPGQGAADTVLKNDGLGNLSWGTGGGTITGPGSSTDTALVRWNGTAGTSLLNSGVTLSATQDLVGPKTIGLAGSTSGTLTLKPAATTVDYTLTMPSGQGGASTTLINDGTGILSWGAGGGGGNSDYMVGNLADTVFSNLSVGDHAPFNQAYQSSNGTASTTNITLDTTSPYSSGTNTASIGRITLKANLTYTIMGIIKSLAGVDYYGYCWFNSDTNTRIGTRGEGFASTSQAASTSSNPSYCTLTPSVDTRIELRLTESSIGSLVNWYAGSTGYGETMFSIITVNAASASNSFTGATSSVSGSQGLVPAPAAGKQLSFLKGDATWVSAVSVQTSASRTTDLNNYWYNSTTQQLEFYNGSNYITNTIASITTTGQTGSISDKLVLFTPPSSTALTYTLPDPSTTNGTTIKYMISNSVTALNSTITLNAPSGKTVNGASSFVLACVGDYVTLLSNGTDWMVVDKPTGRLLISYQTVSAASNITFDRVFAASKYTSYSLELSIINAGGSGGFTNTWRLRSNGASITAANYSSFGRYVGAGSFNQGDATANSGETSWAGSANIFNFTGAGDQVSVTGEIANPQSTTLFKRIILSGSYTFGGATFAEFISGQYRVAATTADGFIYTSSSGTITGYGKIYANCE